MGTIKEHLKQKEKEKIAYDYYINKGYTPEQALGIVGNLIHESGLNTSIIGDKNLKHNAYGIAQWRMDRFDRLKQRYGNEWTKFENQLEFVDWELNNTHKKAGQLLKSAKSAHEAGQIFSDEFERPKLKYHQDKNRYNSVSSLSKRLIGYTPDMNYKETFLSDSQQLPNFAYNQTASVVLPDYATLPEPIEEVKQEEQKSSAESKLEEKQKEQDFLDYFKQNKEQLSQSYPTEQEQPKVEAPQLTALDYYNQANQILSMQQGGIITDNRGQWAHPGKVTRITSPSITMQNVSYPVLGISEQTGEQKIMMPNLDYFFDKTKSVIEYPLLQNGGMTGAEGVEVQIDRGNGVIETIKIDSQEYKDLYNKGLIGAKPKDADFYNEIEGVTVVGRRKNKEMVTPIDTSDFNLDEYNNKELKESIQKEPVFKNSELNVQKVIENENSELEDSVLFDLLNTKDTSKEVNKEIQTMLVNKGFLKNEKEIDGIVGKKTKKAISDFLTEYYKNKEKRLSDKKIKSYEKADLISDYVVGNINEYIVNPLKEKIKDVDYKLGSNSNLITSNIYDQTEGVSKYLLDQKSLKDIRKEKNISFLQITENKGEGNTYLPLNLKEKVINSTYPQGYGVDISKDEKGAESFDFLKRFNSEESNEKQVKRLEGKKGDFREDIYRMYSGLPQKYDTFTISNYKAGNNSDTNITYKNPEDVLDYLFIAAKKTNLFKKLKNGEITQEIIEKEKNSNLKGAEKSNKASFRDPKNVMWNATFGINYDENGLPYLSFYDKWDLAGKDDELNILGANVNILNNAFGKPIEIYDRIPLTQELIEKLSKIKYKEDNNDESDKIGNKEDLKKEITNIIKNDKGLEEEYKKILSIIKNRY